MTSLVIGLIILRCAYSLLTISHKFAKRNRCGCTYIYIATLFVRNIKDIEWDDIGEAGPAVLAMIAMPFTYSISNGIALAFVSYAAIKIMHGKNRC